MHTRLRSLEWERLRSLWADLTLLRVLLVKSLGPTTLETGITANSEDGRTQSQGHGQGSGRGRCLRRPFLLELQGLRWYSAL